MPQQITWQVEGKKNNPQVFDPDSSAPLKDSEKCLLEGELL